jgi:hypothetical protein
MTGVALPSAALRRSEENLRRFIERARNELRPYGELAWDAMVWDVTAFEKKRGTQGRNTFRIMFSRFDESGSRLLDRKVPFDPPFADFIRAVIVHRQEQRPRAALNQNVMVRAARYLYEQLGDVAHDPTGLTLRHFNQATAMAAVREEPSSRYRLGVFLAELAGTIDNVRLAKATIGFKNPFARVDRGSRIDQEADRGREKLPSDAALRAIAAISNLVTESADVIRVRAIELLVAGGFRINELLTVPVDCLVERPAQDGRGGPLLDGDGNRIIDVGIRYWAEKGGPISVKWASTPLADTVRRAVRDIRSATEEARALARWMWENPGRAWLGPDFDGYGRDDLITTRELLPLIGVHRTGACQWLRVHHVPFQVFGRIAAARRRDLEAALLELQPNGPMVLDPVRQEIHESLFVCFLNQFHQERATNRSVVAAVTDQQISDMLDSRGGMPSVFQRFGMTEENGNPIRINSHMFRHWLNTLAQEGGMSQHEIARWMGRRRIDENAAYDHISGFKMAENARELFRKG